MAALASYARAEEWLFDDAVKLLAGMLPLPSGEWRPSPSRAGPVALSDVRAKEAEVRAELNSALREIGKQNRIKRRRSPPFRSAERNGQCHLDVQSLLGWWWNRSPANRAAAPELFEATKATVRSGGSDGAEILGFHIGYMNARNGGIGRPTDDISRSDALVLAEKDALTIVDLLRLFRGALRLGQCGAFLVEQHQVTFPLAEDYLGMATADEQAVLLEAQSDLHLRIPCSPADLVAWASQTAGDFILPEEFVARVEELQLVNVPSSALTDNLQLAPPAGTHSGTWMLKDAFSVLRGKLGRAPRAEEVFNYLSTGNDRTGAFLQVRQGNLICWKNRGGGESQITYRALANHVSKLRRSSRKS